MLEVNAMVVKDIRATLDDDPSLTWIRGCTLNAL